MTKKKVCSKGNPQSAGQYTYCFGKNGTLYGLKCNSFTSKIDFYSWNYQVYGKGTVTSSKICNYQSILKTDYRKPCSVQYGLGFTYITSGGNELCVKLS